MKGGKLFIFCIVVFAAIILTGISIRAYLNKTTSKLLLEIKQTQGYINSNDWVKAEQEINQLNKYWNRLEAKWTVFINHHEIDDITIYFKTSSEYIRGRDKTQSLAALASLTHYVSHIPEMERLSIENIF